jgi:hypothetical protein
MNWMNSVRGRLALVSAIVIALVLTIAGVALVVLFESYIERRVAQELHSRLVDLAGAFDLDDKGQPVIVSAPSDPRYRTPVQNLYICGSATHPGGGIMAAPGRLGALEILKDWSRGKVA